MPRAVAADLQHVGRRDRDRRPAGAVLRIVVRDQHAERVVAAAQIEDDEVAPGAALRAREIGEKRRRREADGEGRDAAAHEFASGDAIVCVSLHELVFAGPDDQVRKAGGLDGKLRIGAGPRACRRARNRAAR